jgi:NADH dehydrogenase FAD-containing subunit
MSRPRIVIVGGGFAGFHAARTLARLAHGRADIMIINPTDYFLYLPLPPEVAAGLLEPRRITALYLRDHMTRQIELADATDDDAERGARCTFVVVGAGYTGTEVAAQGVFYTDVLHRRHPRLGSRRPRWLLRPRCRSGRPPELPARHLSAGRSPS